MVEIGVVKGRENQLAADDGANNIGGGAGESAPSQSFRLASELRPAIENFSEVLGDYPLANLGGPRAGLDRPYTRDDLVRGLSHLPEFMLQDLVSRRVLGFTHYELGSVDGRLEIPTSMQYALAASTASDDGAEVVTCEIQLFDYPEHLNMGRDSIIRKQLVCLANSVFPDATPIGFLDVDPLVRQIILEDEYNRVERQIEPNLAQLSADLIAEEAVLHEIGGYLWRLLPRPLQKEWRREVYPMFPRPEQSGVYFRLLVYANGDEAKFAEESFSDKFARFMLKERAPELDCVGRTLQEKESDYMKEMLSFFQRKHDSGLPVSHIEGSDIKTEPVEESARGTAYKRELEKRRRKKLAQRKKGRKRR